MNATIPENIVGYVLTDDYAEIRTNPTMAYSAMREDDETPQQFRERVLISVAQLLKLPQLS